MPRSLQGGDTGPDLLFSCPALSGSLCLLQGAEAAPPSGWTRFLGASGEGTHMGWGLGKKSTSQLTPGHCPGGQVTVEDVRAWSHLEAVNKQHSLSGLLW